MPEIFPHELFDRQQPFGSLESEGGGHAQLFRAIELIVRLAGGEVHFVAQPQQELKRGALPLVIFAIQMAHQPQAVGVGIAVAAKPIQRINWIRAGHRASV